MSPRFPVTKPNRICGIDPGLARFGWAVLELNGSHARLVEAGRLTTPAGQPDGVRLQSLYERLMKILTTLKPQRLAIEKLFFSSNVSTAMAVGQARGVALLAAAQKNIPVAEFTPTTIKQAVAGYGRADKHQVQSMLKTLLDLKQAPASDDMADAMAAAWCGIHSYSTR